MTLTSLKYNWLDCLINYIVRPIFFVAISCGGIILEETVDLSSDSLLMMMMMISCKLITMNLAVLQWHIMHTDFREDISND
jgi:hypothetical protein